MALEREHKFLVSGAFPTPRALFQSLSAHGVGLLPQGARDQHDRYYDLASGALLEAGVSLRVRRLKGDTLATLKLPGRVHGSLHERLELELPLAPPLEGAHPKCVAWPAPIREQLGALGYSDLGSLAPFLELSTRRERTALEHRGEPFAELSFDEVRARRSTGFVPEGAYEVFRELELEAYLGAPESLFAEVAQLLRAQFSLEPHAHDKVTRALALLAAASGV